jgi:hypothetical protein
MHKHGIYDQLPLFRMKIGTTIPELGNFPHTPILMYVKKDGNDISEMKILSTPTSQVKVDAFLKELEEAGNIKGLSDKIKLDVLAQLNNW